MFYKYLISTLEGDGGSGADSDMYYRGEGFGDLLEVPSGSREAPNGGGCKD